MMQCMARFLFRWLCRFSDKGLSKNVHENSTAGSIQKMNPFNREFPKSNFPSQKNEQQTDLRTIVIKAQSGDTIAFHELVKRIRFTALRYAAAILRDTDMAEDALQEALLDAYLHLSDLRNPGAFVGWFRHIVFKQCDRIRRRKEYSTISVPTDKLDSSAANGTIDKDRTDPEIEIVKLKIERYKAAVNSMNFTDEERNIAKLRFEQEMSYLQIADVTMLPLNTVKNRIRKIRQRLHSLFNNKESMQNASGIHAISYKLAA